MFSFIQRVLLLGVVLSSASAFAGDPEMEQYIQKRFPKKAQDYIQKFNRAAAEACRDKGIGAECTIEFTGGSVTVGVCIVLDGPAGGYLSCKINPADMGCKNNSVGQPTMLAMLIALGGGLWFLRRKRLNT